MTLARRRRTRVRRHPRTPDEQSSPRPRHTSARPHVGSAVRLSYPKRERLPVRRGAAQPPPRQEQRVRARPTTEAGGVEIGKGIPVHRPSCLPLREKAVLLSGPKAERGWASAHPLLEKERAGS